MPKTLAESFEDLMVTLPSRPHPIIEGVMRELFFVGARDTLMTVVKDDTLMDDLVVEAANEVIRGPEKTRGQGGLIATAFARFQAYLISGETRPHIVEVPVEEIMYFSGAHALIRYILGENGPELGRAQTVAQEVETWRQNHMKPTIN